jgi:prepilin-type N-terminal cleavage/methylation domain-containing protein
MPGRQWSDSNGFTMIEALLAMALLSIAIFGTFSLLDSVMGYNKFAETITTATTLAQDKVEALKNTDYASIPLADPDPAPDLGLDENGNTGTGGIYSRSTIVKPDPTYSTNIKQVTVTVSWSWKGNQKDVTLRTMLKE